jgi:hypothetical protein
MDAPTGGATLLQELVNVRTLEQTGPGRFGQTLIHAVFGRGSSDEKTDQPEGVAGASRSLVYGSGDLCY